uniref:Uncharacterized protein LOC101499526 n=1 Tax=Cicer arietinum TaxID=3827 RepID=A0A3Q7YGZ3_CICAR|nr:uncharacterized protein LOC101499526 [Cicer arietinum]
MQLLVLVIVSYKAIKLLICLVIVSCKVRHFYYREEFSLLYLFAQEQLQAEIGKTPSPNEAFVNVFGKEHLRYVCCMGLGITPSQITTSTSHSVRSMSSSEANEKMEKMQAEIDRLKKRDSEVDMLKEKIAFLLQMQNSRDKQEMDIESPIDGRRLSESSHQPDDRGTTSLGTN